MIRSRHIMEMASFSGREKNFSERCQTDSDLEARIFVVGHGVVIKGSSASVGDERRIRTFNGPTKAAQVAYRVYSARGWEAEGGRNRRGYGTSWKPKSLFRLDRNF